MGLEQIGIARAKASVLVLDVRAVEKHFLAESVMEFA